MPHSPQADISMQHFPDISDTSFQIPSFQDNTSGLLCEHRLGGLELDLDHPFDEELGSGLDIDPFMTPLPTSRRYSPLRLSEITPRRERERAVLAEAQDSETTSTKERSGDGERWTEENTSVRHTFLEEGSVDDMFERRKRDNYQQMGIDLSSKSTARLRRDKDEMERLDDAHTSTMPSNSKQPTAAPNVPVNRQAKASGHHVSDAPKITATKTKPKPKRPVIDKDAGIAKHKSRVTSAAQPKSILKPSKAPTSALPPSTLTRTLTTASHTPETERPKWGDVVAEAQQTGQRRKSSGSGITAIGGGLIDVLVMYGEKLRDSLGFSSASKESTPKGSGVSADVRSRSSADVPHHDDPITNPAQDVAGPSSRPLRLSDLSPCRPNRPEANVLTLSDLSPSKHNAPMDVDNETGREQSPSVSPMRQSRKRSLTGMFSQESKRSKLTPDMPPAQSASSQPISKQEKATTTGPGVKSISKPQPLGASRVVNKATTQPRSKSQPLSTADGNHRLRTATSTRDLKGKAHGKSTKATHRRCDTSKEQHPDANPTLPSGPVFASDVYRQRALEKERERKDTREKNKRVFPAGFMPHFSKPAPPARPAVRPTIPAAFRFHSDARATQRNAEFEEKRKTWEARGTHQALPMPDFAAIHAAQAETLRSRKVMPVPILPTDAPTLTTMARAKEREKFEAERRERERVIEEQLEMRERERAEQEEKEYKEARKRTVPKANEVPEWYKDSRKRKPTT